MLGPVRLPDDFLALADGSSSLVSKVQIRRSGYEASLGAVYSRPMCRCRHPVLYEADGGEAPHPARFDYPRISSAAHITRPRGKAATCSLPRVGGVCRRGFNEAQIIPGPLSEPKQTSNAQPEFFGF